MGTQTTNWLKPIVSPTNATLDIVAIHGMNIADDEDHADNTWTDRESGTNWLRDLLPLRIPNARILSYQYNANVAFGTSVAGVEEQAKNLLLCLGLQRKSNSSRPIVFIAHSLGGIIVKEALVQALQGDNTYAMIWIMTYGLLFFAVPHRGSKHAKWGRIAANILGLFSGQVDNSFLSSIESGSEYNEKLNARFEPLLKCYKFFTSCETLPEKKNGINHGIIVDKESAILGLPDGQEVKSFPNRSHTTVCKFASAVEPEWMQISDILCVAANFAVGSYHFSPTIPERKKMLQDLPRESKGTEDKTAALPQVVKRAQDVLKRLKEGSESSIQIQEVRGKVNDLTVCILSIAAFFMPFIVPIMNYLGVASVVFSAVPVLVLPSKAEIMKKTEEARQSEKALIELERFAIEALDNQRRDALQSINMLQVASGSTPLQNQAQTSTDQIVLAHRLQQELQTHFERTVWDLLHHHKVYNENVRRLKLIEEGQRITEGMNEKEILMYIAKKAGDERDRVKEEQSVEKDSWCC